jgi:transmembrane sensor
MKTLEQYQEELERNFRIAYLIGHFIQENLSEEEEVELENWIQLSDHNMQIFEDLTAEGTVDDFMKWYAERDTERNLREVKQRLQFYKSPKVISFWRYAAAASIIILLGVGIYFLRFNDTRDPIAVNPKVQQDISPGQYSATLTLANGQRIDLTKLKDTIINEQVHIENGAVIYSKSAFTPEYNELSIPRKGFYQLILPDGSKAWINSSSSIRYPTRFTGNERRVSVTGETYFEVAKDALHPFIVSVNGTDVTDLGTAFNINAYPEEDGLKVTLTEGIIKVSHANKQQQLKPGDQLLIHDDQWSLSTVDVSRIIAWTKNQFKLKNTTIEEVMRMASRWYDAKIIYEDQVTDHFTGTIDRSVPISELLKLLEATGQVHFRIEGDTIIVSH